MTSIWPPFVPEMTSIWPCLSENGYLVTLECSIIPNHPRMLDFKGPRKHLWFWRSWRSNGGQNEVGSIRRWHIRKIWAKIELCAKKTPNRLKTVTANPHPPLKCPSGTPPFGFNLTQVFVSSHETCLVSWSLLLMLNNRIRRSIYLTFSRYFCFQLCYWSGNTCSLLFAMIWYQNPSFI